MIQSTIDGAMRADARAFNGRQPRNSLISMSMKVGGAPHFTPHRVPAAASAAMELEIACEKCSCRFAVIGSAYFCPACGHSSVARMFDDSLRKIRAKKDNVEVVRQAIAAVGGRDEAELMCRSLIESCLQDGVTAFRDEPVTGLVVRLVGVQRAQDDRRVQEALTHARPAAPAPRARRAWLRQRRTVHP